ncbi:hypothetical protein Agub_g8486, partial [Astrephomene gubernaculifera]
RPFQLLSTPWRPQLPDSAPPPQPHEFCIDTQRLHRLQADAARASGLFDTAARVFVGRRDGRTYQVWRLADVEARRRATFKALSRVLVEPAEDPWSAAAPLASAQLPLSAALSAPPLTRLELTNLRRRLAGQPAVQVYEPSDEIATRTLACRTATGGEKLLCTLRVTARLSREPEVSEQLMAALHPALQAGTGSPSLPPLHWLSLLGAEELALGRLLAAMRQQAGAAASRVMALPPHGVPERQAELRELVRQAEAAVQLKERQLAEGLSSCGAVVEAAVRARPGEAQLARARLAHVREHVVRSLAALLVFFRQRLELYRLGAAAWHFITAAGGPEDPVARLPVTTTPQQAQGLATLLHTLAAALHALMPPGTSAAAMLTGGGAAPLAMLPPLEAAAAPSAPSPAVAATGAASSLTAAARDLETALRAAIDAAATSATEAFESLRREVAAPGADDVALTEAAQVRLAALAAPVTSALVGGLSGLCEAAVGASLAEADTAAALREQLMASAAAAAAVPAAPAAAGMLTSPTPVTVSAAGLGGLGGGGSGVGPGSSWLSPPPPPPQQQQQQWQQQHLVAHLAVQLQWQAVAASPALATVVVTTSPGRPHSTASTPTSLTSASACQLSAALQSLQWLLGAVTRAAPAPVPASAPSAAAWLKASVRLRLQLGVLASSWVAGGVAAAGHALLLGGQRGAAVVLALHVMGREVDRVIDATKATLDTIRANRTYDDAVLSACLPPLANALTSHAAAAVTACFWLATQLLMTPLLVAWQQPQVQASASAPEPPLLLPQQASREHPSPRMTPAPAEATGHSNTNTNTSGSSAAASGSSDSSGAGGCCYSASLHVASHVNFTLLTLGSVNDSGAAAPPPTFADPPRPVEPSLAPLGHPMLTTWQPRGSVLYIDIGRLNAMAAAVAAGAPADAAPPVDTAALPLLPAAAELLGWSVRHADEYYNAQFTAAAGAAVAADDASTAVVAKGDKEAASVKTAPVDVGNAERAPSEAGSVKSSHGGSVKDAAACKTSGGAASRRSSINGGGVINTRGGSLRGSISGELPASAAAAAGGLSGALSFGSAASAASAGMGLRTPLVADPLAALSESKLAARMAAEADVAVLAGGRPEEAGSMVKWLSQHGMLVVAAGELQSLLTCAAEGGAAAGAVAAGTADMEGGSAGGGGGSAEAARELARALVGLLSSHHLQKAAVRMMLTASPSGTAAPARQQQQHGSRSATPRTSSAGSTPPPSTHPQPSPLPSTPALQPLAVLTHLTDTSIAKPALAACGELGHRLELALCALQAAFAAAPALQPHADMLVRHVSRQLTRQRLLLEGLLLAPELLRARQQRASAAAAAAGVSSSSTVMSAAASPRQSIAAADSPRPSLGGPGSVSGLSRQSSASRLRSPLPSMPPKGPSRRASLAGSTTGPGSGAPAAAAAGAASGATPGSVPGAGTQPPLDPAASLPSGSHAAPLPSAPSSAAAAAAATAAVVPEAPAAAASAADAYSTESEDEE